MLLALPISFQGAFLHKRYWHFFFHSHKVDIYWSTVCSKPSTDSIAYGKAQALQPDVKGLFEISVSQPPLYIPNAPAELQFLWNGTTWCSPNSPSPLGISPLGRKLWDTSFGQSAPQSLGPSSKDASNMHYSASCLFHLRYLEIFPC